MVTIVKFFYFENIYSKINSEIKMNNEFKIYIND
jgi:hypothetical protein